MKQPFSSLDKIVTKPYTKEDVLIYYRQISKLLLPHLKNYPFSMICFPSGIKDHFYQKECPPSAPAFVKRAAIDSKTRIFINWPVLNNLASIEYMVNRNIIEMHTWFSRLPDLTKATTAIIDLDPSGKAGFKEVIQVAQAFQILLDQLGVVSYPMTSGASGMHIRIPIPSTDFPTIKKLLLPLAQIVVDTLPQIATLERLISKRANRIYLDIAQNGYGKTIITPYSLRARPGLPVATPLLWSEVRPGLKPSQFTIINIFDRLAKVGDLTKFTHRSHVASSNRTRLGKLGSDAV